MSMIFINVCYFGRGIHTMQCSVSVGNDTEMEKKHFVWSDFWSVRNYGCHRVVWRAKNHVNTSRKLSRHIFLNTYTVCATLHCRINHEHTTLLKSRQFRLDKILCCSTIEFSFGDDDEREEKIIYVDCVVSFHFRMALCVLKSNSIQSKRPLLIHSYHKWMNADEYYNKTKWKMKKKNKTKRNRTKRECERERRWWIHVQWNFHISKMLWIEMCNIKYND